VKNTYFGWDPNDFILVPPQKKGEKEKEKRKALSKAHIFSTWYKNVNLK
jgi:hypothetical protein